MFFVNCIMKTLLLFFIVSYIAASADLFIYAESSDLVLVKKQSQIWCAARGETAYSALSWSSISKNSDVYEIGFNSWNSHMGCNLLTDPPRCQQWYGWSLANSTYYHMPPVLDYRWNDFRLIVTDGSSSLEKENDIPIEFQDNIWEITLSVAAERDAYIYLCEESDPREDSSCYWIILGGWAGKKDKGCAIRRCYFMKNCKSNKVIKRDKVVKEGAWVHVTLKLNKTVDLLLEVCVENQTILSWNDPKPFDIQYLNVRSDGIRAYFRIHKYNFLLVNENQDLFNDYFEPESAMQCWSIVYSFLGAASEDAALEVKIEYEYPLDTQVVKRLNNSKGEWHHEKFIFKTKEETSSKMRLIITGTGKNSIFAVGGIRQCSLNGDTRISEMSLVSEDQSSKLMCQALQYPEKDVTLTSLNQNFKDCEDCTMNCKQFGIPDFENKICFGTSLCKNMGSESVCFCSAGYYEEYCSVACSQRYGVNCRYPCGYCKDNGCEIENGTCRSGCEDGYRPPLCKKQYLVLNNAPKRHSVTFTSIAVYIINTTNGDDVPAEYKLQYMLASNIGEESEWVTEGTYIFNSSLLHNITNLTPATQYAFRAVVIDKDGGSYDGKNVSYSLYSTNCNGPENIVVEALRNSININWKIAVYACAIQNYTFVIEKDGERDGSVSWAALPFKVTGLKPFTNYVWKLLYNGLEIENGFTQTQEDVPSEVRSLTIDNTSSQTSLIIKWESPENPNGKIRYYRVQYLHCGYLACIDQECSSPEENHTDSTTIQLENLKPYSKYNITVTAFTIDYGKENSEIGLTRGFGTLKIRPEFINNSLIVKEREVELYWTLDCTIISGKIIGYDVILKGISEWIKESVSKKMFKNNTAKFDRLHPYSKYSVSILVHGEDGASDDEYALVGVFTTKPVEPGKVRNAASYSFGESWIHLRWEKPYPPTGELEYFEVQYFADNKERWKKVNGDNYCSLWKEMLCVRIDDLESDIEYEIVITAKNKDVEQLGEQEIFYVTTRQEAPDPPLNVTAATISSRKITLTWKHPDITRGKLTRFEAKATLISTGLNRFVACNKTEPLIVNDDQIDYILEVDCLCPASDYQIDVYGITVAPGRSSTIYCSTNVSEPYIGSHLSFIPDSVTSTTFQIAIPEPDEYLTDTSAYILIVTSENDVPDYKLSLNFNDKTLKRNILKQVGINNDRKSWIAAEIKPGETKQFEIGDNKTQESVMHFVYFARNRPLTPGGLYQVTLVAVNMWRGEYRYNALKLEKSLRTLHKHEQEPDYTAAWVVAVLLILCIPLLLFWFIKRRRIAGKQEKTTLEMKVDNTVIVADTSSVIETENSESKLPPSQRFSRRVIIDDLEQYVKTGLISGELQRQHALFPRGQTRPWDYGKLPENKTKNRYGNLVAYDETRVKLKKLPGDQFSDYINANYINGYNSPRFYIATQGPKRNTVVDFWRMIWQEHVQVIVMLANVIEDTRVKCEKYWPEFGQEVTHGTVTILNASNKIFADYTFRQLNVSCKGKTRKVHHLHFTSWPDHGVPMYPQSLASFLKKLLATSPGSGPITVHCSAGVGRTGTVILSDICLRMAAAEGHVDMLSFLQQIREQRANMVDNLDQYKLVHLLLLECLVTEPSSYQCDASFEKRVQELSNSGIIEKQFSHLFDIRWQDEALRPDVEEIAVSPSHTDTSKNRNLDIVPGSNGRVFISPFPYDDPNSNYINAVYVDGFRVKDQFIVTQFPLESTISDFWRLISEKKVAVIVVLNEINDEDKSVFQFWPSNTSDSMTPVPHITLTKKQEHNSTYWKRHDIHIDAEEESRTVHILHLKDWRSDEKLPPSTSVILELWQETERLYNGSEPIVVCCLDGAMACGYFVALAFLIEKIKLEQQCDVCQAVRTVRQNRKHFVATCDQFEYLYKAAVTYLDFFQIYANFN